MKKRYRTSDGEVYEISDAEVNDFMTDFPDAIEVETYTAEGEEYDISPDEVSAFMTDFPNAVKKKGFLDKAQIRLRRIYPLRMFRPRFKVKPLLSRLKAQLKWPLPVIRLLISKRL